MEKFDVAVAFSSMKIVDPRSGITAPRQIYEKLSQKSNIVKKFKYFEEDPEGKQLVNSIFSKDEDIFNGVCLITDESSVFSHFKNICDQNIEKILTINCTGNRELDPSSEVSFDIYKKCISVNFGTDENTLYSIGIPIEPQALTNEELIAIFLQIVLPIGFEFDPDVVFWSFGNDLSSETFPLVTQKSWSLLTHLTKCLAAGRNILTINSDNSEFSEDFVSFLDNFLSNKVPRFHLTSAADESSLQKTIIDMAEDLDSMWKSLKLFPLVYKKNPDESLRITFEDDTPFKSVLSNDKTCLAYNEKMCGHYDQTGPHPECPQRITRIFEQLTKEGLVGRCEMLPERNATHDELTLTHTPRHVELISQTAKMSESQLRYLEMQMNSVFICPDSYELALMSAGYTLEAIDQLLTGKYRNGACVIRPPGHHAEAEEAYGFCLFNNVAVSAKYALEKHGLKRILVLDWDVHHGNGTQNSFYEDEKVLYLSLHRYDYGFFFPVNANSNYTDMGRGPGRGFNVNIPWSDWQMGDPEYLEAFSRIVLPICLSYNPDLVIVSAGFDAAEGDPLGAYKVTPPAFAMMTQMLTALADSKILLVLEGGYNLDSLAACFSACTEVLLGDPVPRRKTQPQPISITTATGIPTLVKAAPKMTCHPSAIKTMKQVMVELAPLWPSIGQLVKRPEKSSATKTQQRNFSTAAAKISPESSAAEITHELLIMDINKDDASKDDTMVPGPSSSQENPGEVIPHLYAVTPLRTCPHVDYVQEPPEDLEMNTSDPCKFCSSQAENWLCLSCYKVHCSRFVESHGVYHYMETDFSHPMALSFSDLSVWCYPCDSYVNHPSSSEAKRMAHRSKFGFDPPDQD